MILWASTRRGGRSLAEITRMEIGPVAGFTAAVAILFIIIIALGGLGLAVVNALRESAWGTFTIGMTIPLAIFMGFYMFRWTKGKIAELQHWRGRPVAGRVLGRPWPVGWGSTSAIAEQLILTCPLWLLGFLCCRVSVLSPRDISAPS